MTTAQRSILALALAAVLCGLPGIPAAAQEAEMPECLANPGVATLFGFTHRPEIFLDDRFWYFSAPELELNFDQHGQPQDLPGHCWSPALDAAGFKRFIGKHFNTGPLGMGGPASWWSSDAGDHAQLYWVDAVISPWSPEIAARRARDGYVHYHELVRKDDGCLHPTLVAWLRHTALQEFTFDGGPPQARPDGRPFRPRNVPHAVHPGLDLSFPPNYDIRYLPERLCLPD